MAAICFGLNVLTQWSSFLWVDIDFSIDGIISMPYKRRGTPFLIPLECILNKSLPHGIHVWSIIKFPYLFWTMLQWYLHFTSHPFTCLSKLPAHRANDCHGPWRPPDGCSNVQSVYSAWMLGDCFWTACRQAWRVRWTSINLVPLFGFRLFQSLCNLTDTSAAVLPKCPLNFRAMQLS